MRVEEGERVERRDELRTLQNFYQAEKANKNDFEKMVEDAVAIESDKMWSQKEQ